MLNRGVKDTLFSNKIMQKNGFIFLFILFCCTTSWAQQQDTIYRFFKGAVNKSYSITMELRFVGTTCEGRYFYDKYRKDVLLEGELKEDKTLILREIDDVGEKTSTFVGTVDAHWKIIKGFWENKSKERNYDFNLWAIENPGLSYNFEQIRRFQELLNYFDLEPRFPFSVRAGIDRKGFNWKNTANDPAQKDYEQLIPYALAKQFIMNQVALTPEGTFDYFNIKKNNYKSYEMHYKSLCCVYRSKGFVVLLFHFVDDTGWDNYNVSFLLSFDYAGRLLDACKVGKDLSLESVGKKVEEQMSARFEADSSFYTKSQKKVISYGKNTLGKEFYQETNREELIYYTLQASGRFLRRK